MPKNEIKTITLTTEDSIQMLTQKITGFLENNEHTFVFGLTDTNKDTCSTVMNGSPQYIASMLEVLMNRFSEEAQRLMAENGEMGDNNAEPDA